MIEVARIRMPVPLSAFGKLMEAIDAAYPETTMRYQDEELLVFAADAKEEGMCDE
jgi:hypothetical protein